jgi:hypothetical protein
MVAYETNNDIKAQTTIDKAIITCGVFNSVYGHPMHDEKSIEEIYVLVQVLKECNAKVFGTYHLSFRIIGKLDSIAPNLCS